MRTDRKEKGSDMEKITGMSDKVFVAYYQTEIRRSRNAMLIGFAVGGLVMLCGIARLLLLLGEVTWKK